MREGIVCEVHARVRAVLAVREGRDFQEVKGFLDAIHFYIVRLKNSFLATPSIS